MKRFARPRQTVIFILTAVTLMIGLDIFVLKGWRPYREAVTQTVQSEIVMPADRVYTVEAPEGPVRIGNLNTAAGNETASVDEKIVEDSKVSHGPPRENKNNMVSNAIRPRHSGEKVKVVLIIDDMGVDKRSKDIIALQPPLTLAFLPYATHLKEQTAQAQAKGHELMIHVPMEPMAKDVDPGPNVLTTVMQEAEFMAALNGAFESFDGYVGINNHMGSRLTQNAKAMKWVMGELKKHNLLFVDSKTTPTSVAGKMAGRFGVAFGSRDIFIDHNNDMASIRSSLHALEELAHDKGYAIAIGHPRENTIIALKEWLPTLEEKGIVIVPVTQLVRIPMPDVVARDEFGPPPSPQP
jgi:polysaccharide deacetylase 2 family uncharacterized protein YibQ